ncbi:hypothetical protein PRIPAC_94212 [Pristionchus pacificus]|uniref:Uncharacterized protein n=1 Tax=Pristionchus pacificus TaxID=54126 RepID=A0A2A6BPX4_PRIPA|nr:hypothetical protein PRIPAC_94212 [Pristionchus pacificus]|eukprot:PDM67964.1 hypothetical protein PRIPAC_46008 [Pristionchus pacificus]
MSDSPPAKRKYPNPVIDPNAKEGSLKFTLNNVSKMEIRNTQYFPFQSLGGFPWRCAAERRKVTTLANRRYSQDDHNLHGTGQHCKWDAITDPTKGFIKEDSIKIEAAIRIKGATAKSFRTKSHYDFFSASEMADAVLTVEDKDFHVSKQVRDAKILILKTFYEYRIDLIDRDDKLEGILRIADIYDIKGVLDEAEKWLLSEKKLTLERKLMYADRHRLQVLQDHCLKKVTTCEQIMALRRCNEYKLYSSEFKVILFDMFADFSQYK